LVALLAVPDNVPVITPALKLPEPSLKTNVFGVFNDVADVKVLVTDCKLFDNIVILLVAEFKLVVRLDILVVFAEMLCVFELTLVVNVLIELVAELTLVVKALIELVAD
jgi:hypothetical protein